jgi:thiamine pyrophosphate-dependent acetolactate synthase large subunit-like protein
VQRTEGELVVDSLKAAGIDTAFGIASVHNIPIFDAMAVTVACDWFQPAFPRPLRLTP